MKFNSHDSDDAMKITPPLPRLVLFLLLALPALAICAEQGGKDLPGKFLGAVETEYPDWFKESFLDFNDDLAEAAKAGKRIVILFHQNGCPYCNLLVERNLSQQAIVDYMKTYFDVVAINMWGDRDVATIDGHELTEKQFAEALKVQFTPTLVFLDETGEQVLRLNGYLPPERFMLALQYAHKSTPGEGPSFTDFIRQRAPVPSSGKLVAEPFFLPPPHALDKLDRSRPVAIWFEQKHCPACENLHADVIDVEDTKALIRQFNNIQLDMWSKEPVTLFDGSRTAARDWAKKLGIHYAPTIVFFDPDGNEIIRSEAMLKQFHTQSIFDYVSSGAYRKQPSFQRFLEERADRIRSESKDVDIWR